MPAKRRASKVRLHRITPEAVAAFKLCMKIREECKDDDWEEEGGRREEYIDAERTLRHELGMKPWECSPLDVALSGQCPSPTPQLWVQSWDKAQSLRHALDEAARES